MAVVAGTGPHLLCSGNPGCCRFTTRRGRAAVACEWGGRIGVRKLTVPTSLFPDRLILIRPGPGQRDDGRFKVDRTMRYKMHYDQLVFFVPPQASFNTLTS